MAWFTLDPVTAPHDVMFTNGNRTATTSSFDDRVVLANVGFTKGVHYWEVIIDRYENNKDPAIGVARIDVAKDKMLGWYSEFLYSQCFIFLNFYSARFSPKCA